jgi:hypothetical protein
MHAVRKSVGRFSAAVAIATVACSTGGVGAGARWVAATDTIGDTIVVRTTSGSVWGDTADLIPEIAIGTLEGEDEYVLGEPSALAVGGDGTIYVLDQQVFKVRAYGPDGTHRFDIGREGGGPGEFKNPDGMATLPDGRIVVRDPGNARLSVYSGSGEYLAEWRHPSGGGFNTSTRYFVDSAGNSYALVLRDIGLPPWEWTYALARISPAGELLDSLFVPTWDYDPPRLTATSSDGRSSSATSVPFTPNASWTLSPLGYFVGGLSTSYRIDLYRIGAPLLRIERTDWLPVPVLPEEKVERERRITENWKRRFPGWRWNGPPIPDTKPPFNGLFADAGGRIWIELSQPGIPMMTVEEAQEEERRTNSPVVRYREPLAFDVFSPDGAYLGPVRAPTTLRDDPEPIVRGDLMWAVTRDELDVPSVVRFRIVVRGAREQT